MNERSKLLYLLKKTWGDVRDFISGNSLIDMVQPSNLVVEVHLQLFNLESQSKRTGTVFDLFVCLLLGGLAKTHQLEIHATWEPHIPLQSL